MRHEMGVFAVHRHEELGHRNRMKSLEFLLLAMSAGVNIDEPAVDHPSSEASETIADRRHRCLISGDRVCGEYDRVVFVELQPTTLASGHLGERRSRLSLRSGTHNAYSLGVNVVHLFGIFDRMIRDAENPHLSSEFDIAPHGKPDGHDDPVGGQRTIGHLLQSVDMARERSDDHTTLSVVSQQRGENAADFFF